MLLTSMPCTNDQNRTSIADAMLSESTDAALAGSACTSVQSAHNQQAVAARLLVVQIQPVEHALPVVEHMESAGLRVACHHREEQSACRETASSVRFALPKPPPARGWLPLNPAVSSKPRYSRVRTGFTVSLSKIGKCDLFISNLLIRKGLCHETHCAPSLSA